MKFINTEASKNFIHKDNLFYDVNFFQYHPQHLTKDSHPSSYLLALAFEKTNLLNPDFITRILEIQKEQGISKTLWGLRFENKKITLEFYFFYPQKFKENKFENLKKIVNPYLDKKLKAEKLKDGYYLISYNLNKGLIEKLNVYYPVINKKKPVITIDDTGFSFNTIDPVFHSYYLTPGLTKLKKTNTYYTFFGIHEMFKILKRTREVCLKLFPKEDPAIAEKYFELPYIYKNGKMIHTSAVTMKTNAIGLYFLDISIENFIVFLKYHKYPEKYITSIEEEKKNLNHLKFDIGVDFYIKNGIFRVKKTAFWGTF